jgi:hypothetical protein
LEAKPLNNNNFHRKGFKMYTVIGIGLALGLIGIGIVASIIAGIRSLSTGKQDIKKVVTFLVPFAVFGVAYGVTSDATEAGIATMLFLIAAMGILIGLTGLRSMVNI